jgi:hypothetical protein
MYEKLLRFNRRKVHPLYSQNKKRREDAFRSGALQVPEKKTAAGRK